MQAQQTMSNREKNLKRLREPSEYSSAPLLLPGNHLKKIKLAIQAENEDLGEIVHWNNKERGEIKIGTKRDGSLFLKYVDREHNRRNLFTMLCELQVVESCMYEDGDLNVETPYGTVTDPKKAKYKLTLSTGYPENLKSREEKMGDQQKECVKWLHELNNKLIDFADDNDIIESKTNATSFMKEDDRIELKRNICDFRGNPTPVKYWRKNKEGRFERFFPAEIPVGAVVLASVYPRLYNFERDGVQKCGMVGDLGEDLIVVYSPKARTVEEIEAEKRKEEKKSVKDALEDIPYIEF